MKIQQRLDNLESKKIIRNPNFCACNRKRHFEPGDGQPPSFCELCAKPLYIVNITSREMRGENLANPKYNRR
jgi:hypothetical protein